MKRLIVNADDLGMSDGINWGILEAHHEGIVSSSTAIVTAPQAKAGIRLAQREAPDLGLGLHFNLSYGRPLSSAKDVPSLVRSDGSFVGVARGLSLPHHLRSEDIRAELTAQFERFTELAGVLPDHLDSHQLIGSLSAECREVMLDIADAYDLPVRQGGRNLFGQFEREFASWGRVQERLAPSLFARYPFKRHRHIFEREARAPDYFDYRFHGENATASQLIDIIDNLQEGVTELVCHPGYADPEADSYPYREQELAALKNARVKEMIGASGVVLSTFVALKTSGARA